MGTKHEAEFSEEQLRRQLCVGHGTVRLWRRLMRITPSNPRCKLCNAPFGGIGRRVVGPLGFSPSRKNPRICAG